jgi:ribose 5-phosphate isomerase B
MNQKRLYIGADHAGFELKEKIKKWFDTKNIEFKDLGNLKYEKTDDYPDFAAAVARKVAKDGAKGIIICGSAEGVCIAANKIKGIRAVNPTTTNLAILSREHNDANILCLSGWFLPLAHKKRIINAFLTTPFSNIARHKRRLMKIRRLEK